MQRRRRPTKYAFMPWQRTGPGNAMDTLENLIYLSYPDNRQDHATNSVHLSTACNFHTLAASRVIQHVFSTKVRFPSFIPWERSGSDNLPLSHCFTCWLLYPGSKQGHATTLVGAKFIASFIPWQQPGPCNRVANQEMLMSLSYPCNEQGHAALSSSRTVLSTFHTLTTSRGMKHLYFEVYLRRSFIPW